MWTIVILKNECMCIFLTQWCLSNWKNDLHESVHIYKGTKWGGVLLLFVVLPLQVQVWFQWQVVFGRGRVVYCGASRADGGNALPRKYCAWHMLRLLPLRRPLPLLLCWLRQQAQSFCSNQRTRERKRTSTEGWSRSLWPIAPPVSSSLTSQGARNKNEPPSAEFFTSRRAHLLRLSHSSNSSVHIHTQIRWYWTHTRWFMSFLTARSSVDIVNFVKRDLARELRLLNWFESGKRERGRRANKSKLAALTVAVGMKLTGET